MPGPMRGGSRGRGSGAAPRGSFRGPSRGPPRGGSRAPRGRGPPKTGRIPSKVALVPHRFDGVFIAKGKSDALVTRNLVPGVSVYGEKRIQVEEKEEKTEYRVWNPFRSKLGATIVGGSANMPIVPGAKVLYLGGASGTTVSHVSDMVGPRGLVFAVEFSHRVGRDLTQMAAQRSNVIPIVEDARQPLRYRMIVDTVDVIFSDVAQPDQERIVALNASYFLKSNGWIMICVKAACVDCTVAPEAVFAAEVNRLRQDGCKPKEQLTLEPYHRDHAMILAVYRHSKKVADGG